MRQIESPEKSQGDQPLNEPTQGTRRAAVVIGAPACYVTRLEPQGCTGFINLDLKKGSSTRMHQQVNGMRSGTGASSCSILVGIFFSHSYLRERSSFRPHLDELLGENGKLQHRAPEHPLPACRS